MKKVFRLQYRKTMKQTNTVKTLPGLSVKQKNNGSRKKISSMLVTGKHFGPMEKSQLQKNEKRLLMVLVQNLKAIHFSE